MYQIVLTNCPSNEVAQNLAQTLVAKRLAACVNIVPKITSIYLWQDEIQTDQEVMLIIKTKISLFSELEQTILQLHPYEVVEVISLNIQQGNEQYLDWIQTSVKNN